MYVYLFLEIKFKDKIIPWNLEDYKKVLNYGILNKLEEWNIILELSIVEKPNIYTATNMIKYKQDTEKYLESVVKYKIKDSSKNFVFDKYKNKTLDEWIQGFKIKTAYEFELHVIDYHNGMYDHCDVTQEVNFIEKNLYHEYLGSINNINVFRKRNLYNGFDFFIEEDGQKILITLSSNQHSKELIEFCLKYF